MKDMTFFSHKGDCEKLKVSPSTISLDLDTFKRWMKTAINQNIEWEGT